VTEKAFTSHAFYQGLQEGVLLGSRCQSCGALFMPPKPICTACHGSDLVWEEFSGRGKLAAFTIVHIAPTAMLAAGYGRDNPYCAGVIALEEGPSISGQILEVDVHQPETIALGTPLVMELVSRGEGEEAKNVLAFKPV
jgi:uncharacterized OB-fold protein